MTDNANGPLNTQLARDIGLAARRRILHVLNDHFDLLIKTSEPHHTRKLQSQFYLYLTEFVMHVLFDSSANALFTLHDTSRTKGTQRTKNAILCAYDDACALYRKNLMEQLDSDGKEVEQKSSTEY